MSPTIKTATLLVGAFIILSVLGFAAGIGPRNTAPITIGAVLGQTGDAASDSLNIQRGMELARIDLAEKGINVDIRYEDDQTDPTKTVLATQRLITLYHPNAFIGFTWDFLLASAAPILTDAKIPTYSPANTAGVSGVRSDYVFFGAPRNETKTGPITEFLKAHNVKKVAIVIQTSAWGLNHVEIFKRAAADAGASVVLVEQSEYGKESSTLPTIVAKIKQADAEALLWSGGRTGLSVVLPKIQDLEVDIPIVSEIDLENVVENGLVTKRVTAPWVVAKTNVSDEFVEKFKNQYGEVPGLYADIAYDGFMVLVEAIRNTDGTPEAVVEYMRNGKVKYQGYSVPSFAFDPDGGLVGGTWTLDEVN